MSAIDVDDLAMLATGFQAALRDAPDPAAAATALFDLGWAELLAAAPAQGIALAFGAQGATGAPAGILDDVVARALGLAPAPTTAVLLPAPGATAPPGRHVGERIAVDGTATARLDGATTLVISVATDSDGGTELVAVDPAPIVGEAPSALDPDGAHRRVRLELDPATATPLTGSGTWDRAIASARVALAHELVASARTMLDQARQHALDRVQFGRAVSSFQAVRHRLAEALVHIEGAAAVVDAVGDEADPLLAALAKSLAGQAARATGTHAQQVLGGIGFTTDHPFQRRLKRTLVLDALLGSATSLPAEIGAELLRRRGAPRLLEL